MPSAPEISSFLRLRSRGGPREQRCSRPLNHPDRGRPVLCLQNAVNLFVLTPIENVLRRPPLLRCVTLLTGAERGLMVPRCGAAHGRETRHGGRRRRDAIRFGTALQPKALEPQSVPARPVGVLGGAGSADLLRLPRTLGEIAGGDDRGPFHYDRGVVLAGAQKNAALWRCRRLQSPPTPLIKVLLGDKSGIWKPTRRQPDYRRMPIVG